MNRKEKTEKKIKNFKTEEFKDIPQIVIDKSLEFFSCFSKFPPIAISCSGDESKLYFQFIINKKYEKFCDVTIAEQEYNIEEWSHNHLVSRFTINELNQLTSTLHYDNWYENKFQLTYEKIVDNLRKEHQQEELIKPIKSNLLNVLESWIGKQITQENISEIISDIQHNLPSLELNCYCENCLEDLENTITRSFDEDSIINPNIEQYSLYIKKCKCKCRRKKQ